MIEKKILIMKFPFLGTAFVLLSIVVILAGCIGSPSAPANGTSGSVLMSQLLLLPSEIPFGVADEKSNNPDMTKPEFLQFGAIKGITRTSFSEKAESATSVQLSQTIIEYPEGNAVLAFDWFEKITRNRDQSRYKVTWLPDPGIGNKSCALIVADLTGVDKPTAMVVFVKANVMESVAMKAPSLDTDALTRAARAAAAKIP
jgi:hypothetical protein